MLLLAWGAVAGRSQELAVELGGSATCFFPPGGPRPPVPARWALSAAGTVARVLWRRPDVLVVTNPPAPAALVGWMASRLVGARFALDSHPGSFGAQGDRVAARLQRLNRWVTKRAVVTMVASEHWRSVVGSWGATAVVVHESPTGWERRPAPEGRDRPQVLYVGRFARDEPWQVVLEAAAAVPGVDVVVTGDPPPGLDRSAVPPNVRLAGFLDPERYRAAVYEADCVMALTTEPGSIVRAGCEAVWAGRPLIVSDWPEGRSAFPYALHAHNDAASVAGALAHAADHLSDLRERVEPAYAVHAARWRVQRQTLLEALDLS